MSDGEDVSTPELIRQTAAALGMSARLFPVPLPLMRLAGKIIDNFRFWILNFGLLASKSGNSKSKIQHSRCTDSINRLTGSLTVDSSGIRSELGWLPPYTMEEGLAETARWFKRQV